MNRELTATKRAIMVLLGTITAALAVYMAVHTLTQTAVVGCGPGSPCDTVLSSRWSMLFGIVPVGALAAGLYAAYILLVIAGLNKKSDHNTRQLSLFLIRLICGAITGSAVWFTALQIWVVRAFCPYCMATHALGIITVCYTLWCVGTKWKPFASGLALSVLLVLMQTFIRGYERSASDWTDAPLPQITLEQAPLIGSKDAEHIITLIFDFQCNHCRNIHPLLEEIAAEGEYAFLCCPTPLSPECNPYIPKDQTRFAGSCQLSRQALALWYLNPDLYGQYERALFRYDDTKWLPLTKQAAYDHAVQLAGSDSALETALENPLVEESLSAYYELFGRTTSSAVSGVPRLIYAGKWIVPETTDIQELKKILISLVKY